MLKEFFKFRKEFDEKSGLKWASDYIINKKFRLGLLNMRFSMRDNKGLMGRFGGGWKWKLGFQASGGTVLFSLLVAEFTIHYDKDLKYL